MAVSLRSTRLSIIAFLGLLLLGITSLHLLTAGQAFTTASAANECTDGIDNDNDGYRDYPGDPDCDSSSDPYEGTTAGNRVFVSVTDGKDAITAGGSLVYVVTLNTDSSAETVDVRMRLPGYTDLIGANQGGKVEGAFLVWRNITVNSTASRRLTANISVNSRAPKDTNLITEVRAGSAVATDTTRISDRPTGPREPSVRVSVTDGKIYAQPEEVLQYRVVIENLLDSPQTVDLNGQLPTQFVLHEVTGRHTRDGGQVEWSDITLAPGATAEFFVKGHISRSVPDFYALRMSVSADGARSTDSTSVAPKQNAAQILGVQLTDNRSAAARNEELTYQLRLTNNTTQAATNITAQANLPQFTHFVGASDGGRWTGTEIFWDGLSLSQGNTRTIRYTVRVDSNAPIGSDIRAGAVVEGREARDTTRIDSRGRADTGGSTSSRGKYLPGVGYLPGVAPIALKTSSRTARGAVTKTVSRTEARPGDVVRYTVTFRNTTNHRLINIVVKDSFDANQLQIRDSSGRTVSDGIEWTIASLNPGEEWTTSYQAQLNPNLRSGAFVRNLVTVHGQGLEPIPLTQRRSSVQTGIIHELPAAGVSLDGFFLLLSGLLSLAPAGLSLRRQSWL